VKTYWQAGHLTWRPASSAFFAATANDEPLPSEQLLIEDGSAEDTGTATTDASEVSAEVAEAIHRMHSEGRTVRSISRTLKVRELLVRFVLDANSNT
jgi:hypothetical protein